MNLDLFLLDTFDTLTTRLQRKGYRLTTMQVHAAGATLASTMLYTYAGEMPWLMVFCGIVWGGVLMTTARWASAHHDYPESLKMIERLNARVLFNREYAWGCRIFILIFAVWAAAVAILQVFDGHYLLAFLNVAASTSPAVLWYLDGCFFIGPGEFAKEREESEIHNAVTQATGE